MIKNQTRSVQLHWLGCLMILCGLFFSRALMSMGMMALLLAALIHPQLKSNWNQFMKDRAYLIMSVYALIMMITVAWSTDMHYAMQRITIVLPFLVLPFSFFSFRDQSKHWGTIGIYLFLICLSMGNLVSLTTYFSNKEFYDASYGFSKVIPTPFKNDHIRYSLAVAIGCAMILQLFIASASTKMRLFWTALFLFFTIFIHVLSSKTGIISYYLVCFLFFLSMFRKGKGWKVKLGMVLLLVLIPFLSYRFSNTFRRKLSYLEYSLHEMANSKAQANVSDEGRVISYRYAWNIIQQSPWFGVGIGDVYHEMDIRFKRDFPERTEEPLLPHNQFLMSWVAGGIFFCLYLLFFQTVWFIRFRRRGFLSLAVFTVLFLAMLFEPLFETQYGACIYVFLILFVDYSLSNALIMKGLNKF